MRPLIATAESLRFLTGEDIDPIVRPLADGCAGTLQAEVDFTLAERRSIHVVGQP